MQLLVGEVISKIKLDVREPVVWIRIRIHFFQLDPYPHWEYGSGCRRAKTTHESVENSSFEVLDVHF
jgi:hypothetical protein